MNGKFRIANWMLMKVFYTLKNRKSRREDATRQQSSSAEVVFISKNSFYILKKSLPMLLIKEEWMVVP